MKNKKMLITTNVSFILSEDTWCRPLQLFTLLFVQRKALSNLILIHELTDAHDWPMLLWLTWKRPSCHLSHPESTANFALSMSSHRWPWLCLDIKSFLVALLAVKYFNKAIIFCKGDGDKNPQNQEYENRVEKCPIVPGLSYACDLEDSDNCKLFASNEIHA